MNQSLHEESCCVLCLSFTYRYHIPVLTNWIAIDVQDRKASCSRHSLLFGIIFYGTCCLISLCNYLILEKYVSDLHIPMHAHKNGCEQDEMEKVPKLHVTVSMPLF